MFTAAKSSKEVVEDFCQLLSAVAEFLAECCIVPLSSDEAETPKQMVFDAWRTWAREGGLRSMGQAQFGRRLLAHDRRILAARVRVNNQLTPVYRNLRLTREAKERYLVR